jgi:hypothetical protein
MRKFWQKKTKKANYNFNADVKKGVTITFFLLSITLIIPHQKSKIRMKIVQHQSQIEEIKQ